MASQAETIDDMITTLMSMGFELSDAQDAFQFGKLSAEEAVEWILAGKPGYAPTATAPPTLKLAQMQGSGLPSLVPDTRAPFSRPLPIPVSGTEATIISPSSPGVLDQSSSDMDMEQQVVSRLHLTEDKVVRKHKFEEKERMDARKKAQQEKLQAKRDRERALKEIAEDREIKKMMRSHGPPASQPSLTATEGPAVMSSTSAHTDSSGTNANAGISCNTGTLCSLQIRLPSGRQLRKTLDKSMMLGQLWRQVLEELGQQADGYSGFMQPFPRREFSATEMNKTLEQLGMVPTGSLVLKKRETVEPVLADASNVAMGDGDVDEETMDVNTGMGQWRPVEPALHQWGRGRNMSCIGPSDNNGSLLGEGSNENHERQPLQAPSMYDRVPPFGPGHQWGRGRQLEGPSNAADIDGENDNEDDDDDDHMFGAPQRIRLGGVQGFGGHAGLVRPFGGGWMAVQGSFMGVGQRLIPEGAPGADNHNNQQAAALAAEAARQRQLHLPEGPQEPQLQLFSPSFVQVTPLKESCFNLVISRIIDPVNPLRSLGRMPHYLAEQFINYLLQNKLLDPKTIKIFMSCYLNRLILDAYIYATNELLYAIRLHLSLQTLSLHSCPLINDQGVKHLEGLKNLKVLNLGLCKQITNKSLKVIAALPNLQTLSLEETGVTDSGLASYFATKPCLRNLNLSRTAITNDIFLQLQNLKQLQKLYIEETKITSLSGVEGLKQLTCLNIANTPIPTNCLLSLAGNTTLTHLNLCQTDQMEGDLALQYISGLKLRSLVLPDRHSVTSNGLAFIVGFSLSTLDLTNYIHVEDEGMVHVGKMTSLTTLMLTNTKVTDEGLMYLSGLTRLRVLYLDRVAVSDVGIVVVKSFKKLQELSLSTTNVTNLFLTQGVLHHCQELSKLNLSRTNVGDKGVQHLKLPYLTLLNLDCTRVHPPVVDIIRHNCPSIKYITTANLAPLLEEAEEEEDA